MRTRTKHRVVTDIEVRDEKGSGRTPSEVSGCDSQGCGLGLSRSDVDHGILYYTFCIAGSSSQGVGKAWPIKLSWK